MTRYLLLLLLTIPYVINAQGKYESEAPFERLNAVVIPKEKIKRQKTYRTKRLRKQNKGAGNKLKLNVAFKTDILFLNSRKNFQLDINDNTAYYNKVEVGQYQNNIQNERHQNMLELQNNETAFWTSNEIPTSYTYESNIRKEVIGGNIEWRFIKNNRMGPPQGFYINTGILLFNAPIHGLDLQEKEILFPVGLGIIIPGDEKLRVEMTTNAVIGTAGNMGIKFDFSFVYKDLIKFGPSFNYLQNTKQVGDQLSGIGLHVGFLLPR